MSLIKKTSIIASIIFCLVTTFTVTQPASAALFTGAKREACRGASLSGNGNCDKAGSAKKISSTIQNIVNVLTIIVGIAAIIVIIVNGLKFITSSGDSNSVTSAKNGVIYALVGLAIVALAQVIVRFTLNLVY